MTTETGAGDAVGIQRPGCRRVRLLAALAAALVAGCVTTSNKPGVPQTIYDMPICCRTLAELPIQPLAPDSSLAKTGQAEHEIDGASPAFEFEAGKSAFSAFALPVGDKPRRLKVSSAIRGGAFAAFMLGPAMQKDRAFFVPLVTLLDADRKPLRTTSGSDVTNYQYSVELSLTYGGPGDPARYAIIHTSKALAESIMSYSYDEMSMVMAGRTPIPLMFRREIRRSGSYFGTVTVSIADAQDS